MMSPTATSLVAQASRLLFFLMQAIRLRYQLITPSVVFLFTRRDTGTVSLL